jgi:hypothetical protein
LNEWLTEEVKYRFRVGLIIAAGLFVIVILIDVANLYSKYGSAIYQPATAQDQERLLLLAKTIRPPGSTLKIGQSWYGRDSPHASVSAYYTAQLSETSVLAYYAQTLGKLGWTPCPARFVLGNGRIYAYRKNFDNAALSVSDEPSYWGYQIEWEYSVPNDSTAIPIPGERPTYMRLRFSSGSRADAAGSP